MRLHELTHPSQCKWKTVGLTLKYQNVAGNFVFFVIFMLSCAAGITFRLKHVYVCLASILTLHVCSMLYSIVRHLCGHTHSEDIFACGIQFIYCWVFVRALPHLIPFSALGGSLFGVFIPLCCCRLSVGPSPQPCCSSVIHHGICYSSHVVMNCQKEPWQMLPFCLWNDHVGLTLQNTSIIQWLLHLTCKICFVGMNHHNSKVGR